MCASPKTLIHKYGLKQALLIAEPDRGLLSWTDTLKTMADGKEHRGYFDTALPDGLEDEDF